MIECLCCPRGEHVKCQRMISGVTQRIPCTLDRAENSAYCTKHTPATAAPSPVSKQVAFRLGLYKFSPPPVPTAQWDEAAWIKYITYWTVPVKEE